MNQKTDCVLRLFLVRHGETAANTEMRYLGSRDDPLTERGVQQADLLAISFEKLPITAVISSPMRRAVETAAPIARKCGLAFRTDPRLREGGFGEWEGLTRREVQVRSPEDAFRLERWEEDPRCTPPGGESMETVQRRVMGLIEEEKERGASGSIVLVSHVGPIKALLAAALDVPISAVRRFFLDPATVSVVDWGVPPLLRLFNSHGHLGWDRARWMIRT